jgi:stage V sporulation protein S
VKATTGIRELVDIWHAAFCCSLLAPIYWHHTGYLLCAIHTGGSMVILKVASQSNPNSVSGAIAGALEAYGSVEIHAIGAGAVNQTIKAIAIARRLVEVEGAPTIKVIPGFMELEIDGERRTSIRFIVER